MMQIYPTTLTTILALAVVASSGRTSVNVAASVDIRPRNAFALEQVVRTSDDTAAKHKMMTGKETQQIYHERRSITINNKVVGEVTNTVIESIDYTHFRGDEDTDRRLSWANFPVAYALDNNGDWNSLYVQDDGTVIDWWRVPTGDAVNALGEIIDSTGTAIGYAVNIFGLMLNNVGAVVGWFLNEVFSMAGEMATNVADAVAYAVDAGGVVLDQFVDAAGVVYNKSGEILEYTVNNLGQIINGAGEVVSRMINQTGYAIDNTGVVIGVVIAAVLNALGSMFEVVGGALVGTAEWLGLAKEATESDVDDIMVVPADALNTTDDTTTDDTTTDDTDSIVAATEDAPTTTEEMTQSSDGTVDVMATESSSVVPPLSYNHVMKSIVLISAASFGVVAMMI